MFTPANADSVRMILDNIVPKCKKIKEVYIIGNCPQTLRDEYSNRKEVIFTGKVDDLREHVKTAMLFLAPIAYGTGIKTKILEAMAMKMVVITNSVGAEGINAENGCHWLVSDDPITMVQMIDKVLENEIDCEKIATEAQSFVRNNYQWDIVFNQFKKLNL